MPLMPVWQQMPDLQCNLQRTSDYKQRNQELHQTDRRDVSGSEINFLIRAPAGNQV